MARPFLHNTIDDKLKRRLVNFRWQRLHIDAPLILSLLLLSLLGLAILYSASNQNAAMVNKQAIKLGIGFVAMLFFAQIPPKRYEQWAPWLFSLGVILLIAVLVAGKMDKGARRWLDLGLFRFQPSELMKLMMPMMLAWILKDRPLPPTGSALFLSAIAILLPVLLTAKQPDLGTAIIIALSGLSVLFLAGLSLRFMGALLGGAIVAAPLFWHFMHTYQRERVLTFLNPERDPLGSGYHIIQSKIALGSGGFSGKGWLSGTQSHLHFLPAHATDFIFAVVGEEWGLIGAVGLLLIFLMVLARSLFISANAQTTFTRLVSGGLALIFIFSAFINIGMVIGILPVVGVPLPFISYGGSSLITMMISFGIIMSIQTHKQLIG